MKKVTTLQKQLPVMQTFTNTSGGYDLVDYPVAKDSYIRDGVLHIHNEWTLGQQVYDYYGEFTGGYPYIAPELENWARKNNMYWECVNPASIALYSI